ncbi:helix-turn-helix domain-containing protein [Phreatobacter oligotrophus]|uniref:helix-turn-helix domain-containing protein n=1 Tax=Phreatobacter oligotrophus TaxID=1122261 RepID=UPI000D3BBB5E|nr:helix-turn-helix transcriptional regulator [Phreatobacter oligotrophus]MBY0360719.1 helix-turn-helix domain-containing protein [Phreatobacter sp.]
MDIRKVVARNLRRARRSVGFSQEVLAERAKVDRSYVSRIETAKVSVGIDTLANLARALGVRPIDLLEEP